jgi:uncharacterized BrkB/YihY/UPF0761 family membrane protein
MKKEESSGITGLFIMLMLYTGTMVISSLILYEYLVHIHRDGRILDLYRRFIYLLFIYLLFLLLLSIIIIFCFLNIIIVSVNIYENNNNNSNKK